MYDGIIAPVDDLEALFEDEDQLGDAAGTQKPDPVGTPKGS